MKAIKVVSCITIAVSLMCGSMIGCTKAPSKDDVAKLEEAKSAAESAEKKLSDVRQERMKLEAEKQKKGDDK